MKGKLIILNTLLLAGTIGLTSCGDGTQKIDYAYFNTNQAPVDSVDKNAQAQLAETATSVNQSLQQLSAIKMATHPGIPVSAPANAKQLGLTQMVSVNWHGPAESILKQIAKVGHYKFQVLGTRPNIPVLVNINDKNVPLANVLRDVAYQISTQGTVETYPKSRIIELRYKKNA